MKDSNLGRSFKDLIEENERNISENEEILELDIRLIKPNPEQPRTIFSEDSLKELASSIVEHGVIQPIIVKPTGNGYTLVAGERRVRASQLAGLTKVPAIVREYNAIYLSELSILENLQREDLTAIEEAIAFQKAIVNLNLTHEQLGKKIGKSRAYVTNILGLLNLPAAVINNVNSGLISMGHARALSKLKDNKLCLRLCDRILKEKLTVRDIEGIIRGIGKNNHKYIIPKQTIVGAQMKLDVALSKELEFKVKKNSVVFTFENEKELQQLMEFLLKGRD